MTTVILRGANSVPKLSSRFQTPSTTTLYHAVPWLEIHNLPMMESFLGRAFFEAALCAVHLSDTGSEEATTVSVV